MSKIKKLLQRIYQNQENFNFKDFIKLIQTLGFIKIRQKGSHIFFKHSQLKKDNSYLVIQNNKGKVKPYQAKQFLNIIEKYKLEIKNEN